MIRIMEDKLQETGQNMKRWPLNHGKCDKKKKKDMQSERTEEQMWTGDVPLRDRCLHRFLGVIHLGPLSRPIWSKSERFPSQIYPGLDSKLNNFTLPKGTWKITTLLLIFLWVLNIGLEFFSNTLFSAPAADLLLPYWYSQDPFRRTVAATLKVGRGEHGMELRTGSLPSCKWWHGGKADGRWLRGGKSGSWQKHRLLQTNYWLSITVKDL